MEADLVEIAVLRLKLETCSEKLIHEIQELEGIAEILGQETEQQGIYFQT